MDARRLGRISSSSAAAAALVLVKPFYKPLQRRPRSSTSPMTSTSMSSPQPGTVTATTTAMSAEGTCVAVPAEDGDGCAGDAAIESGDIAADSDDLNGTTESSLSRRRFLLPSMRCCFILAYLIGGDMKCDDRTTIEQVS
ncbi:unnamed protein product [Gongylonema pulchrum]|uniref:Secreted protein n=1 Tax=Gongylonema pulchrum TaxID=637853 RepID=A0A183D6N9_9BILA|nr:unnamed protein product [Gongylonema pulchrum]